MIRNIAEVKRGHERLLEQTERLFGDAMEFAGETAEQHVQSHSEFHPKTGRLQRETTHRVIRTRGGRVLKISNPLKYAGAIDQGARAHIILPRRGRVLAFRGRDGRMVFRRVVRHPGNRPYKFLYNATDAAFRVLGQFLREGMTRNARRF